MSLKQYKPVTPSRRGLVLVNRQHLWRGKPEKSLTVGISKSGGRNAAGRLTVRHRGGGHKRSYRLVDFRRRKHDISAVVERFEYDPNRTAFIALIRYVDGECSYILAPQQLAVGDTVVSGEHADVKVGNALPLGNIPVGTVVHNVELKIGKGGELARSAGASAQIVGREVGYVQLKLSSGEVRRIHSSCLASIGVVSNADHQNSNFSKAGRRRWMGQRPHVRGVAMNPVDHPHGGGEGRTSGGRHPVSPWGQPAKGKKTRSNKRTDVFIVRRRGEVRK